MRKLSAKDRAFEIERLKYRKEINTLKERIRSIEEELHKETMIKEYYEDCINDLESEIKNHYNMTREEFIEHVKRERKGSEALEKLIQLGKIVGGFYG